MMKYQEPFIIERADPFVTKGTDGYYYFTASYPMKSEQDTEGYDRVILRRAKTLDGLRDDSTEKVIWKAGENTQSHRFIWAPEIHCIAGKWYVFYAGSSTTQSWWNLDCRVLRCLGQSPYEDAWEEVGKMKGLPEDTFSYTGFSLDMTFFEVKDEAYVIWAQQNENKISCLYIAQVSIEKPWQLMTLPMLLTQPEYSWEKVRYAVNEGPAALIHENKIIVFYSAAGTGPEYCVGMLECSMDAPVLCKSSWKKYDQPVLCSDDLEDEYGPGHNSFTVDEQGNDVIIYHSRSKECFKGQCKYAGNNPLFDPCRHARFRKIKWDDKDFPVIY